jgi:hypothetical protein
MWHLNEARKLIESGEPFDLIYIKENGTIMNAKNVICTSSYFNGNTFNLKFLDSNQFRKIHAFLILNVSGEEIYL